MYMVWFTILLCNLQKKNHCACLPRYGSIHSVSSVFTTTMTTVEVHLSLKALQHLSLQGEVVFQISYLLCWTMFKFIQIVQKCL